VLWNECLVYPTKLDVVDMVDKIGVGFKSGFGPFSKRIREDEQRFKKKLHNRIIAYVRKFGVRVLFSPCILA
jgi:hypothetical protein